GGGRRAPLRQCGRQSSSGGILIGCPPACPARRLAGPERKRIMVKHTVIPRIPWSLFFIDHQVGCREQLRPIRWLADGTKMLYGSSNSKRFPATSTAPVVVDNRVQPVRYAQDRAVAELFSHR
ncbi:unnamed protein product, partial [Ectocarpus sp. 12 AP-2014]